MKKFRDNLIVVLIIALVIGLIVESYIYVKKNRETNEKISDLKSRIEMIESQKEVSKNLYEENNIINNEPVNEVDNEINNEIVDEGEKND